MIKIKEYEIDVLIEMYKRGLFKKKKYKSIEKVAKIVKWENISRKHGAKKNFKSVIKSLVKKGLVDDQGKSYGVCSLTQDGIIVADQYLKLRSR